MNDKERLKYFDTLMQYYIEYRPEEGSKSFNGWIEDLKRVNVGIKPEIAKRLFY